MINIQSKIEKSEQMDSFDINNCVLEEKYYSILPDLATGWRPKNAKIAAPIFVTYEDILCQHVLKVALCSQHKLIFIGQRYDNSYKFHSLTQHSYSVKYGIKCDQVPSKLQKQLEQFTIKSNSRKGIFCGMNGNLQKQLIFQANFQSANLDLVTKVNATQYNLFLRPDTNTRGHMQWFYFKVANVNYPHQKVKFNICNNRKPGVLFSRGMKPYVYSKSVESNRGIKWHQGGDNIEYKKLIDKQTTILDQIKINQLQNNLVNKYYCLSFQYTFQSSDDQVYFAYCPPFTYSDMKNHLQHLKKKSTQQKGIIVTEQNLCTSLTGLEIPIVTIKQECEDDTDKKCVIATGRFHPGESNGSHVIKGFMDFLISPEAEYLRKRIIFKIIPMVNPDGVVFGNYRTSLSGKDLNRKFKAKNFELFPEILNLKNFVLKAKREQKMKIMYFLDFHGHSIKKNVFLYGPEYDIWSTKFQRARILPKMIANKTSMFRYQSCLFRVAATKKTTARAFMLGQIPYCYTIESSVGIYRSFNDKQKQNFYFNIGKYEEMGKFIGEGLRQTFVKLEKYTNEGKNKKKSLKVSDHERELLKAKLLRIESSYVKQNISDSEQCIKITDGNIKDRSQIQSKQTEGTDNSINYCSSQIQLSSSKSNRKNKQNKEVKQNMLRSSGTLGGTIKNVKSGIFELGFPQIKEQQMESDGYSEGKSDCESDDNDFNKEEYKKISGRILKFMQNFSYSVIGERNKKFRNVNKKLSSSTSKKKMIGIRKITNKEMWMVPSLKHKIVKRQFSQKRISVIQDREDMSLKQNKISIYKIEDKANKIFY